SAKSLIHRDLRHRRDAWHRNCCQGYPNTLHLHRGGPMKNRLMILGAVLMVTLIAAQLNPVVAAGKTHDVSATVVAVDAQGKKITFQDDAGATSTAVVMDKAVESLKSVKAGDKVVLTC